jgi:transposase
MDELVDSFGALGDRLIFISDGATWIRNWQTDIFPDAVQIIDYFHVVNISVRFRVAISMMEL